MVVWSTACLISDLFGKEKPILGSACALPNKSDIRQHMTKYLHVIIALRDICTKCKLHWSSKLRVDCQMISNPESIDSKTMKLCSTSTQFFFSVATDFNPLLPSLLSPALPRGPYF